MSDPTAAPRVRSLVHIALTANVLEWYDFAVYGFFALAIGQAFFPKYDAYAALIASFSVFAVSYLIRPLGSIVFGYLGNRQGPGVALIWSTWLMALPTALIGLLPTYARIGWSAPILLLILRLVQGFAAGGEFPLSAYYVAEHATPSRRGAFSGLAHVGGSCGIMLASFVAFILGAFFSDAAISAWAWRLPFLLGIPLFLLIYRIRRDLIHGEKSARPAAARPMPISLGVFCEGVVLAASLEAGFYTLLVWFPGYAQLTLHYSGFEARFSNTLALLCYTASILASGIASTRISYKKILLVSLVATACCAYPLFSLLVAMHGLFYLLPLLLILALFYGAIGGVLMVALYELFRLHGRCLGLSLAFTLSALFGGLAPLACSYATGELHYARFPALYISLLALLAVPFAYRRMKSPIAVNVESSTLPAALNS